MLLEIACDESGSEGEKLVGGVTDVFAHASVRLERQDAEECVREIRDRIRSPAVEYKANHLLREKHRAVLVWLLGESGPIHERSFVLLIDKTLFLVDRMIELLGGERAAGLATTLHRSGSRAFGNERWAAFLDSFNELVRVRNRRGVGVSVDSFLQDVDYLLRFELDADTRRILEQMRNGRERVTDYRQRALRDPEVVSVLDPMVSSIVRTVAHWSGDAPISIVHDEQLSLTEFRISQLMRMCGGRLASMRLVDSRHDARVQLADFLAGVARRIASDELNGRGDGELIELLRPYLGGQALLR